MTKNKDEEKGKRRKENMMDLNLKLQQILGVDKRNPYFTICKDANNTNTNTNTNLYVFFGAALLEVVAMDESNPAFKLLIARLYNAGVNAKSLTKKFGFARTTMKRWGDALKSGDVEKLVKALSGAGAPKKMTTEIKAFIRVRFLSIYKENHYNYSSIIRSEIKEIYGKEFSGETLRPIFNELKKKRKVEVESVDRDGQDGKGDGHGGGWGENYYDMENLENLEHFEHLEHLENMENGSGPGILPSWVETNQGENHFEADFFDCDIKKKPEEVFFF